MHESKCGAGYGKLKMTDTSQVLAQNLVVYEDRYLDVMACLTYHRKASLKHLWEGTHMR